MTTTATALRPGSAVADSRPWASYGRISKRRAGDGGGAHVKIENQHADNLARVHGAFPGAAVEQFSDNMSAWDPTVVRKDWERMMAGLAAGKYQGVIAWHADRFTRQPRQLEDLWDAAEAAGTQVWTTLTGPIDDPTMLRIEGAVAWKSSKQQSNRIRRRQQTMRENGQYHGGQRRFGYEDGMDGIRESEARWVRWAAQGVLAGRSINSLVLELNAAGVKTSTGKDWRPSNLGKYLRQPMVAGLLSHQGAVIGEATWDGILDLATWDAVRTLLENPDRRTSKSQARRYLLAGVATCGECGGIIRARNNGTKATVAPSYFCPARGCVNRNAALVEATVRAHVVARLSQVDASGLLRAPEQPDGRDALAAQVAALEANLNALAEQAALGTITVQMMTAATERVRLEVDALRAQMADLALDAAQPDAVLAGLVDVPDAGAAFDALDLDRRKAVVDLLCTVVLAKAPRKGAPFDPALVRVTWKGGE